MSADGPFKMWLHRGPASEPRFSVNRVLSKSAFGMSMSEMREIRDAIDQVEAIIAAAPHNATSESIDMRARLASKREAA